MMQGSTRNMFFPAFIGAAVLALAFTLLTIVARSPYTHSNLNVGFDSSYTRTEQSMVGAPLPLGSGGLAVSRASDPVELGKQLFVAESCANCHGLDGRGGVVGPSLVRVTADTLRAVTEMGPGGMPAYAPDALSDQDLAAIAAYLNVMDK